MIARLPPHQHVRRVTVQDTLEFTLNFSHQSKRTLRFL